MTPRELRVGGVALVWGLWSALAPWLSAACVSTLLWRDLEEATFVAPAGLAIVAVVTLIVASLLIARLRKVDVGALGRARLSFGAAVSELAGVFELALAALLAVVFAQPGFARLTLGVGSLGATNDVGSLRTAVETVASSLDVAEAPSALVTATLLFWVLRFGAVISAWFLAPQRARSRVWLAFDVPVAFAFLWALVALPFSPREDGNATLPAIALGISFVFGLRFLARALPPVLDGVERTGFEALVSARMLRARKSGFLTAIGALSVLAVSFSSCTLTTTLSVMGGFREDLQAKILGNHSHVVVDRAYGNFEGWAPIVDRVRATEGVVGASPYVSGEVMLTSASNHAGAILRGIDPATVGQIGELPSIVEPEDGLEALLDPERLLHVPPPDIFGDPFSPDVMRLEPREVRRDAGAPVDGGVAALLERPLHDEAAPLGDPRANVMRDLDAILEGLPMLEDGEAGAPSREPLGGAFDVPRPLRRPPREVLPGIILGQELARTLRLHVGDEVDVISPLGDLGPSGPIPRSRPFRVAGTFFSGSYEYDTKYAYAELRATQRFLSTGEAISGIEVKVRDWERAEELAPTIAAELRQTGLRARSWQEVNRNLFGALALEKLAMFVTLGIAILVASFCIVGALVLMVQEKRKEVGILKAMGARDGQIVVLFCLQGVGIGVLGAILGLGLGYVISTLIRYFGAQVLALFGVVSLGEVYYLSGFPVRTDLLEFAATGLAAVVVSVVATVYPAILGSRLRPIDALRYS